MIAHVLMAATLNVASLGASAQEQPPAPTTISPESPAQEDWTLYRKDEDKLSAAIIHFEQGPSIVVRCWDGSFNVLVQGLPEPPEGDTRMLGIAFDDEPSNEIEFYLATNRATAVSQTPALLARRMRQGGTLQIRVPNGASGGRTLRYVLPLPPSASAIDQTLTACDRPLVDPRDALLDETEVDALPSDWTWARAPRPNYPTMRYAQGFVVLSCLSTPIGALSDCVVEFEHPQDGNFGREALRAATHARLRSSSAPAGQFPVRMVRFRVNYRMAQ